MGITLIEYTPQQTNLQTVATRLASIKHLPRYVWYIAYIYILFIYIALIKNEQIDSMGAVHEFSIIFDVLPRLVNQTPTRAYPTA